MDVATELGEIGVSQGPARSVLQLENSKNIISAILKRLTKGSPSPCSYLSNLISMWTLPLSSLWKVRPVTSSHMAKAWLTAWSTSALLTLPGAG